MLRHILTWIVALPLTVLLTCCSIVDDIPLPFLEGAITAFEVEGQCNAAGTAAGTSVIDNETHTVYVYVADTVDVSRLRITRFEVSNDAKIVSDAAPCLHPQAFPKEGFSDVITGDATRVDFSQNVEFTISTYQDYVWTVHVTQVVNRRVSVKGQIGRAVIDPVNENVILYVSYDEDLRRIHVNQFTIGGDHGSVSPDPTATDTYDFTTVRSFDVKYGWSDDVHPWRVFVYQTDEIIGTTATAFPRTVDATVSGNLQNGLTPLVEYRVKGSDMWSVVPVEQIAVDESNYTAEITGLQPATEYECQVTAGESATDVFSFTTTPALQLENPSFDYWHTSGTGNQTLYMPWADGETGYWDTGNRGATTVGASNSTSMTEGDRTFANLQSRFIVVKFAAGNIFTGDYLATDGTNGILSFGRPFEAFPKKLQFDYRFKSSPINRTGSAWSNSYGNYISKDMYDNLKDKPDSCQIYIALLDDYLDEADREQNTYNGVAYPYLIRTRPSALHLFEPKGKRVVAYGQLTQGDDVSQWTTYQIELNYRYADRRPKYIVVVASSSKYGDYFVGGDQTLLQLDNLQLLYE